MIFPLLRISLLFLVSCSNPEEGASYTEERITSRDRGHYLYSVKVPIGWKREDADAKVFLEDTMLPVVTFWTPLRLTFHTFPFQNEEDQIPADLQIKRWSNQFGSEKKFEKVTPQAFGGFFGSRYEVIGEIQGKPLHLLAWSMQLPKEHIRALKKNNDYKRLSSWTIKLLADPDLVKKQREEIIDFVRSLHFIKPI